jgi:zinc protease
MNQAPEVGPVKPYTPPASFRDQIPNGLRIVVIEDHRFPLVSVRLAVRGGSTLVPREDAGLAQAEAELLTSGTPTMNARQIAEEADRFGGTIEARAGKDFLVVSSSCLSTHVRRMFRLLSDVVLRPTFPEDEVSLRKQNMLQELALDRSEPGFLASVQFNDLLYGRNPYSITAPTEQSIGRISRSALQQFHDRVFLPNNSAVVVIAGDIRSSEADNLVQQFFREWRFGTPPQTQYPPPPARTARRIYLVDRPGSAQSMIMLGNFGITRTAPDYFDFLVANEVLGGSFNSRLIHDVREEKGYAYSIYSTDIPELKAATWIVQTEVRTDVTSEALSTTLSDLERLRDAPISESEMNEARNYLAGRFTRNLETEEQVANQFLTVALYGLPEDFLRTYVQRVQSVTPQAAQTAARAHISPDRELVVVVGDAQKVEQKLANLSAGMITIFNDKGDMIGMFPREGVRNVAKP